MLETETMSEDEPDIPTEEEVATTMASLIRTLKHFSDHKTWQPRTQQLAWAITAKFHPEIIPTMDGQADNTTADSDKDKQVIREMAEAIKSLTKAVKTLEAKIEDGPDQNGKNVTAITGNQKARDVHATGPTYRPTRTPTVMPQNTNPTTGP
ncbi:hypothetical protein H0H87_010651 [Tephrocybe sp. NHM501043]|nr:hypothetical protein H0H87_010651 [Tephrocybe sp. NHM501043]